MFNRQKLTTIATWIGVYVAFTALFYLVSETILAPKPPEPQEPRLLIAVDDELDWQRGPADAPLTLVEYSDFQCPACQEYFPLLTHVKEELGDELRVVYRHMPVRETHEHAEIAALSSEAAGKQGAFWEMHDLLFARTDEWTAASADDIRGIMSGFAQELQLDVTQFETDLDDEATLREVEGDLFGALASGVRATPTFFLNGELVQLPTDAERIVEILRAAQPAPSHDEPSAE